MTTFSAFFFFENTHFCFFFGRTERACKGAWVWLQQQCVCAREAMGNLLSGLWNSLFGEKETRVLILGLDSAGKTTILYRLHCGEVLTTTPSL